MLIYQARYQWNDIRGFDSDQAHPDVCRRGRLPGPVSRARPHKRASALVAGLRLVLAGLIGLLLPSGHRLVLVAELGVAVFAIGFVYERIKDRATRAGGRPDATRLSVFALWFVVGGGYAIRGLAGLALTVDIPRRPLLGLAAGAALWTYGIAFVTSRWAIESLAFARVIDGEIVWRARADQARDHLLKLARWLPRAGSEVLTARSPPGPGARCASRRRSALRGTSRCSCRQAAPERAGGLLVRASAPTTAALAAGCVAATVAVVSCSPRRRAATLVVGRRRPDRAPVRRAGPRSASRGHPLGRAAIGPGRLTLAESGNHGGRDRARRGSGAVGERSMRAKPGVAVRDGSVGGRAG